MRTAALLALALAAIGSARADSEDLLECTTQAVTPAFRGKVADAMLAADSPETDALFAQLATVAEICAARHGLAKELGEAYFTYSLARLPRDAFAARLFAVGISAAVLDEALDFGAGRTNPVISGDLSDSQLGKIVAGLETNGVVVDRTPQSSWELVGAYAAASSLMWQARAKLP